MVDEIEDGHVAKETVRKIGSYAHEVIVDEVPAPGPPLFFKESFFRALHELFARPLSVTDESSNFVEFLLQCETTA